MGRWFSRAPRASEDDEAKARSLHAILVGTLVVSILSALGLFAIGNRLSAYAALGGSALVVVELLLLRSGRVTAASLLYLGTLPPLAAGLQWVGNGLFDVAILLYPILILVASLLLSPRWFLCITGLALASLGTVVAGYLSGSLGMPRLDAASLAVDGVVAALLLCLAALAGYQLARNMRDHLGRARRSEERYRELVQNANSIILRWSRDGTIIFMNEFGQDFFGYSAEQLEGKRVVGTIVPQVEEGGRDLAALMQRIFVEPERHTHGINQNVRRDGTRVWVEWKNKAIQSREGVDEILSVGSDVTERIHADKQRLLLEERLRQSQRLEAIGTLSGGIAHDFNNLLSAIIGYAELSRSAVPGEGPVADYVDQILRASFRASELVAQILTFSRRADARPVPCAIGALVKETLKFLRASLPTTIEIRERVSANVRVVVDPTQVHQVLMNLGTNAFHAMQEHGGVLEISLDEVRIDEAEGLQVGLGTGCYARLTVSDTGSGIAPEVMAHIFEPYFTTKPAGRGTGLGLSVVHGIVVAAGGAIKVYSEPGIGTTVHVYLPVTTAQIDDDQATAEAPRGTERVLLVDDEPAIVTVVQASLEGLGYRVVGTTSPVEALTRFASDPKAFDLVITDLTMPKLNGDAVARKVLELRRDIPVVICTGYSAALTVERVQQLGVRSVLMKPVPRVELARAIREILDHGSAAPPPRP